MRIGVMMFPTDRGIQPIELAREAESRGFDSLWFPEHSHIPTSRRTPWGGIEGAPPLPELTLAVGVSVDAGTTGPPPAADAA